MYLKKKVTVLKVTGVELEVTEKSVKDWIYKHHLNIEKFIQVVFFYAQVTARIKFQSIHRFIWQIDSTESSVQKNKWTDRFQFHKGRTER